MVLCFPYDMNTSSVRRKRHEGKQPVNKQLTSYSSSLGKRHRYPSVTYSFISSLTTLFRGILPSFPSPPPSAPFLRTTHGCLAFLNHIFFLPRGMGVVRGVRDCVYRSVLSCTFSACDVVVVSGAGQASQVSHTRTTHQHARHAPGSALFPHWQGSGCRALACVASELANMIWPEIGPWLRMRFQRTQACIFIFLRVRKATDSRI